MSYSRLVSQIAAEAHEEWLQIEAGFMLDVDGLDANQLSTWEGSVYGAFNFDPCADEDRAQLDFGLAPPPWGADSESETAEHIRVPSLVVQSCWSHEYTAMLREMGEWMRRGAGAVQMVILVQWTIGVTALPSLEAKIEVYEYAPDEASKYQIIQSENVDSHAEDEINAEGDLPSIVITDRHLFGCHHRDPAHTTSYDLSLNELWAIALDIFEKERQEYQLPSHAAITAVGEENEKSSFEPDARKAPKSNALRATEELVPEGEPSDAQTEGEHGAQTEGEHGEVDDNFEPDQPSLTSIPYENDGHSMTQTASDPPSPLHKSTITGSAYSEARGEVDGLGLEGNLNDASPRAPRFRADVNKVVKADDLHERDFESEREQDMGTSSGTGTRSATPDRLDEHGAGDPQFGSTAPNNFNDTSKPDLRCSYCLSTQCCHGPKTAFSNLPRNFMSAGLLGPITYDGFVAYIGLSTTAESSSASISAESVTTIRNELSIGFQHLISNTLSRLSLSKANTGVHTDGGIIIGDGPEPKTRGQEHTGFRKSNISALTHSSTKEAFSVERTNFQSPIGNLAERGGFFVGIRGGDSRENPLGTPGIWEPEGDRAEGKRGPGWYREAAGPRPGVNALDALVNSKTLYGDTTCTTHVQTRATTEGFAPGFRVSLSEMRVSPPKKLGEGVNIISQLGVETVNDSRYYHPPLGFTTPDPVEDVLYQASGFTTMGKVSPNSSTQAPLHQSKCIDSSRLHPSIMVTPGSRGGSDSESSTPQLKNTHAPIRAKGNQINVNTIDRIDTTVYRAVSTAKRETEYESPSSPRIGTRPTPGPVPSFSPTPPPLTPRPDRISGAIRPGIVSSIQQKLVPHPSMNVITGGALPLPLSNRHSLVRQLSGTFDRPSVRDLYPTGSGADKHTFPSPTNTSATRQVSESGRAHFRINNRNIGVSKPAVSPRAGGHDESVRRSSGDSNSGYESFGRDIASDSSIEVGNVPLTSLARNHDRRIGTNKRGDRGPSVGQEGSSLFTTEGARITSSERVREQNMYKSTTRMQLDHCLQTSHQAPPQSPIESPAELISELQRILSQLQVQTSMPLVPKLNMNITCEIAETESLEVELDLRVKYKSKKSYEHIGICTQNRERFGNDVGICPIVGELQRR